MPRYPFMSPGKRRCLVQIQRQVTTQDDVGGEVQGWETARTTMASIETAGMREAYQSGQFSGQVTHVINVRALPGTAEIAPGMRVLYSIRNTTHEYIVQGVDNVSMRDVELNLMCLEINGGQ